MKRYLSNTLKTSIIFILILSASYLSANPKKIGKIGKIYKSRKQVLIQAKNLGEKVSMGSKVYVVINNRPVILRVSFPMMTTAKCKIIRKHRKFFRKIRKGMIVYRYKKGIESYYSDKSDGKNDSSGKIITSENIIIPGRGIKGAELGMGFDSVKATYGKPERIRKFGATSIYYIYYTKGITISFISGKIVAVFLYSGIKGGYEKGLHKPYKGKTLNNVSLFSSYNETVKQFGTPDKTQDWSKAPIPADQIYYNSGIFFHFTTGSREMVYIGINKAKNSSPKIDAKKFTTGIIKEAVGIKEARIGMNMIKVRAALGKPEKISKFSGGSEYYIYYSKGITVSFKRGKAIAVFFYSGIKGGYEKGLHKPFMGRFKNGVNVFSNYSQVINKFGKPKKTGDLSFAPVPSKWISYPGKGISFSFIISSNKMIYLSVTKRK